MAMILFRLQRKLVKIEYFLKLQNRFSLPVQLEKSRLVKILCWSSSSFRETKTGLGKNLKLTLIMSLGYTAHSGTPAMNKLVELKPRKKEGTKTF